ncbi:MAG: hypothetical protein AAF846_24115 [Chloroflexota bacterium]
MTGVSHDPTRQHDILLTLLDLIESIRYKRYEQYKQVRHPHGYCFTQLELNDVALPTYKNLLTGRSKRLPARQQILEIADYLECTIVETNDLLRCAQYLPIYEPMTDRAYEEATRRAKWLMQFIPLPIVVMGRAGDVLTANKAILEINNLPALEKWASTQRNLIHWFFDTTLPAHELYAQNTQNWYLNAMGAINLLKMTTQPYRNEAWFRNRVQQWVSLPEFVSYWDANQSAIATHLEGVGNARMQTRFLDDPIHEDGILIPFSQNLEVCMFVARPLDDSARYVYKMMGCNLDGIRWESMLSDMETH